MKTCGACGEEKSLESFHRDRRKQDGRHWLCRDCAKAKAAERHKRNPAKSRENTQRWLERNRELVNARKREAYLRNPDRIREVSRLYYHQKREERLAYTRNNRDRRRVVWREWARANPGAILAYGQRRQGVEGELGTDGREYVAVLKRDPCAYCGASGGAIDHIEPLNSGGSGGWDNLTASCRACNSSKHARDLLAFLHRRADKQ